MPLIETAVLWAALQAGAEIAGSETVKLATKQAFTTLVDKVSEVFGSQARRAIAKIEQDPGSSEARQALQAAIPVIPNEDEPELLPVLDAWAIAVEADEGARVAVERAQIRLNLNLGGSAILGKIQNAKSFEANVKAEGDFRLDELTMVKSDESGNF